MNNLSPAELERLVKLSEECGEVIQVISKILLYGYESHNPEDALKRTNRELLEMELGDVEAVLSLMTYANDVQETNIDDFKDIKESKIHKYLHYQVRGS